MKTFFTISFIFIVALAFSQNGITFQIEKLDPPAQLLPEEPVGEILLKLAGDNEYFGDTVNLFAHSSLPDSLVQMGSHPFFDGMKKAYAEHRPVVLSPDMIWLLICQGFSHHVNTNAEAMREKFVNFDGKVSLVIADNRLKLQDPSSPWEEVLPEYTDKIAEYTGNELIDILKADFSTTGSVEKVVTDITIMDAMKPYFEYVYIYIGCGIPQLTLEGTPEDWKKIQEKTRKLSAYDLSWWTSELDPVLQEFVNASEGRIHERFWRNMFKVHSQKVYGAPDKIDGWIIKFFPYDNKSKRNNFKKLNGSIDLPTETVCVDLKYIKAGDGKEEIFPLLIWGGFIGLEQDESDFALRPKIGWMVTDKKAGEDLKKPAEDFYGIHLRVGEVPEEILNLREINRLSLDFINDIRIPDKLSKIKISNLILNGVIDDAGIERIKTLFPHSKILINGIEIK